MHDIILPNIAGGAFRYAQLSTHPSLLMYYPYSNYGFHRLCEAIFMNPPPKNVYIYKITYIYIYIT